MKFPVIKKRATLKTVSLGNTRERCRLQCAAWEGPASPQPGKARIPDRCSLTMLGILKKRLFYFLH